MSDKVFIDTNIFVYAFLKDKTSDSFIKRKASIALLQTNNSVVISTQVINELSINLIKKGKYPEQRLTSLIKDFYQSYHVAKLDKEIILKASILRNKLSLSFWDSLIVSSALESHCNILYTEDMQEGLNIENSLTIINPLK